MTTSVPPNSSKAEPIRSLPDVKRVKKAWKIADVIQATVCSLFAAAYSVYSFADLLAPVPEIVGGFVQKIRIVSIVALPFVVIRIISNIRTLVQGSPERTRWQSLLNISGDSGIFLSNLSSFLSGFDKLTAISSQIAIVAQWAGIAGIVLQTTGVILNSVIIIKSIQVLDPLKTKDASYLECCHAKMQKSVANLSTEELESLPNVGDKELLRRHLVKRIHYGIGLRAIHIITMLFTIAATALFLAQVPLIIPLAIGFGVVIVSLIVQPAEILIKQHLSEKLKKLSPQLQAPPEALPAAACCV